MLSNTQFKKCKKCHEIKNRDEFPVCHLNIDNRAGQCKKCKAKQVKAYVAKRKKDKSIFF
jgi:hypothetical protein